MRRLYKFLNLTTRERFLLINSFLLLGFVRLGLWLLPYAFLKKILTVIGHTIAQNQTEIELGKIVRAVNISSFYSPGAAKCLARALTTEVLMKQQGYSPQLLIGVTKGEQKQLEAHAWIEERGKVVIGDLPDLVRFIPMSS